MQICPWCNDDLSKLSVPEASKHLTNHLYFVRANEAAMEILGQKTLELERTLHPEVGDES